MLILALTSSIYSLTSLAFSSPQGCKAILGFGRSDGSVTLMSLYESPVPRFQLQQPFPIACITWRPTVELRKSRNPHTNNLLVKTEDLLVGDEVGNIYYYAVEWPEGWEVARDQWSGVSIRYDVCMVKSSAIPHII